MWINNTSNDIPNPLHDPKLKISPTLYQFCVVLRVCIAFIALFIHFPFKQYVFIIGALFIVGFFIYKLSINSKSWKNYIRTIILWMFVALDYSIGNGHYAGIFILMDVVMGQQSQYIASVYL